MYGTLWDMFGNTAKCYWGRNASRGLAGSTLLVICNCKICQDLFSSGTVIFLLSSRWDSNDLTIQKCNSMFLIAQG